MFSFLDMNINLNIVILSVIMFAFMCVSLCLWSDALIKVLSFFFFLILSIYFDFPPWKWDVSSLGSNTFLNVPGEKRTNEIP